MPYIIETQTLMDLYCDAENLRRRYQEEKINAIRDNDSKRAAYCAMQADHWRIIAAELSSAGADQAMFHLEKKGN